MKTFLLGLLLAGFCLAKTEVGDLNGAPYRIDVPDNWNGTLLIYCHGYSSTPVKFSEAGGNLVANVFTKAGYAVAQSGYATNGWAIAEAAVDTETLRRYTIGKYGKPKKTIVFGHSMGGFLTTMIMETQPDRYDGAMPLCGPLVPAASLLLYALQRRVVFDYYFPGVLPDPSKVPADFQPSPAMDVKITKMLDDNPKAADALKRYVVTKSNKELAGIMDFLTFVLKDVQQRSGGNPFDNRSTIYVLTGDDNAINEGVKRSAPDPGAYEYVRSHYTLTGKLAKPTLAVHTTYDPLVSPNDPNAYSQLVYQTRSEPFFVQKFVEHDGHCAITPAETLAGVKQLEEWIATGKAPVPGVLKP